MKGKHANKNHEHKRKVDRKGGMSPVKWLLIAVLILLILSAAFYYVSGGFGNFAGFKGLNQDGSVQAGPLAPFFRAGLADQAMGTTRNSTGTTATGTTGNTTNTSRETIQSSAQITPSTNNGGLINVKDNNVPVLDNSQDTIPDANAGAVDNVNNTLNDTIDQTPVGDTIDQTPVGGLVDQVQNSVSNTIEGLGL